MFSRRRGQRRDNSGGIEGLPLMILIMIVIAAVGLGILLYWMNSVSNPDAIKTVVFLRPVQSAQVLSTVWVAPASLETEGGGDGNVFADADGGTDLASLWVHVYDQDDNGLNGATVTLQGAGASGSEITGEKGGMLIARQGVAYFEQITDSIVLPVYVQQSHITCTVTMPGYTTHVSQLPVARVNE